MAVQPPVAPADLLRQHGLKVTAQRLAVLRAVSAHAHSTAEDLAASARAEIGTISRQAVYDVLGALVEVGLVRRIEPSQSPARYEARVDDNHHHLICRDCGRIVDVDCEVGRMPCMHPADDHGYVIDEAEVVYWGRCPDCRTESPESPEPTPNEENDERNRGARGRHDQ